MVKTERLVAERTEPTPGSAWLIGIIAWFIPGSGHLLLKKWGRAAIMGGVVWLCFFVGMAMGGHMFDLSTGQGSSVLLQVPPMIANLGSGALYIISWLLGIGFADDPQQAARATYEYGNTFLLIAGLLNYLTMLDAFDIAAGEAFLRHFLVMVLFAAMASAVFGAMAKETTRERWLYGLRVFAEFIVIGLALGWILYFIPW